MPAFVLQFPIEQAAEYASRYPYEDDGDVVAIGRFARERGRYTRDEFVRVCQWKTPRSAPLVALNSAESIETATRVALSETSAERERVEALRSLRGVDWATASVFLHLAYPARYPILDKRALQALGVRAPAAYSFRFWEAYVAASYGWPSRRAWTDARSTKPSGSGQRSRAWPCTDRAGTGVRRILHHMRASFVEPPCPELLACCGVSRILVAAAKRAAPSRSRAVRLR